MVVFTCGNCGESIKKPSMAKHFMGKCRGPINVTCVDCFKDFRGNEYEAHIKCITEEERYAAKGFVPKASSNKGEKKQQTWFEAVQNILNSDRDLKHDERELLQLLSAHENLPRKKGKFINFLTNAHRAYARRQDLVERVWGIIEEVGKAATANVANGTKKTEETAEGGENGNEDIPEKSAKKSKRKSEISTESLTDEKPKKAKKNKSLNGTNGEAVEVNTENPTDEPPKKAKKSKSLNGTSNETMEIDPVKKPKIDTNELVRGIIQEAGDSVSLDKLIQALQKHCESTGGEEKAAKMLKKIEKHIVVSLSNDELRLECRAIK